MISTLWGPTGFRGFAGKLGQAALGFLGGMTAGKALSSRDMPNAKSPRYTQAILSTEIDWNAPELQTLSASARDFLERLLQVGCGVCKAPVKPQVVHRQDLPMVAWLAPSALLFR